MKNLSVLLLCAVGLIAFSSCGSKQKPGEVAKAQHEKLQNKDYNGYVETIYIDEFMLPVDVTPAQKDQHVQTVKQQHAQILKTNAEPMLDAKGGLKDVTVKSETVSPDGKTADVVLTNTYHNGDVEDIAYALIFDEPAEVWKVKLGPDKEVWKTLAADGQFDSFKIKETDHRDIIKVHTEGERDFIKDIDTEHRDVHKEKVDGEKSVHKVIEKNDEIVIKDKVDGEKEVIRIPKESE
ncbi:hypothetical protein LJB87_00760 [Alistipes sp. OttesenSCG-928-L06]|nr:hypothetical protein [Alistipes sp. OttesenSCG-928-L06]